MSAQPDVTTTSERVDAADVCAACGSTSLKPHFKVRGEMGDEGLIPTTKEFGTALGDIVRCETCGHMQLDRFPSEDELNREYAAAASDDYVDEESGQRESARRLLDEIEAQVKPGTFLDLGCWVGFLLSEAEKRGWKATGIEPSEFASKLAQQNGLDVRMDDLFTADLPKGAWDAVVLGDVLEHLTRANVALDRITELLSPDGALVLLLPDAGSRIARMLGKRWWSVIPTHIHYFTRDSIRTMLERAGYEVVFVGTDPKAFTIRYYLEKGGGYLPGVSKALVRGAERLGFAERMWVPDFRDRMVVIAKRKR